jgi:hypothetical protein
VKTLAEQKIQERPALVDFKVEISATHHAVLHVETPFLPLYTLRQRNIFILLLVAATDCLQQAAANFRCQLVAAGVNPYHKESEEDPRALCADIHQIEVYDGGEVERIYNLYRQFLPELLAISTHSAVYGGITQKDCSYRMRVNPSSFLPHYISQFSGQHLEHLERIIRKEHKLVDLSQMDINPLGGDPKFLWQAHHPLLHKTVFAIELRFIDAQCSFPFIRAQILLLQAIAIYGRSLARKGRRLPLMRDEVIDENKALAYQGGAEAILKPDRRFKKDDQKKGYSYHDKGAPEVATTALLMIIDGLLIPALHDLECEPRELYPIILGAELRRKGKRCFANYAEYQQYLCNAYQDRFAVLLQSQVAQLLSSSTFDIISDYNRQLHRDLVQEIEESWVEKLATHAQVHPGPVDSPWQT